MTRRAAFPGGLLAAVLSAAAVLCGLAAGSAPERPAKAGASLVAVRAGTIHLVEEGRVLEGGATILIRDGRIQAVGADVEVPLAAQLVDYGPDAVIVPGLVAALSPYATGYPSPRTAAPGLRAIDGFDPFGTYAGALASGVTSAYITPAENRLIAGQGALVKLAGDDDGRRVLNARAAIHGAIDASARNTPGYWEPPIPATVDVGIGYARPQLPSSTMGAIVALDELLSAARGEPSEELEREYGREAIEELGRLVDARIPWRIAAEEPAEIRALLDWAEQAGVTLIVDKAGGAVSVADEIAAAGAAVVFRLPFAPNASFRDAGKEHDARWPRFDVPARLVAAGARVAITSWTPRDLLFAAGLASRGGLDPAAALRAITLTPAEILGASDRVGSLRVGKDADLCVLNGPPLSGHASVLATWADGQVVWSAHATGPAAATVIEVGELHLGDGRVLRPGQLLMRDGEIVEVAERVAHPRGAKLVRGAAAMPGMIDALGHLGLEGSKKVPATDFELGTIIGPGDAVDRRVARHGITTVVMTPRGSAKAGTPAMAYKPAALDFERQVIGDPVAVRLGWNRAKAGKDIAELLERAAAYRQKWREYEEAIAAWTPPPPEPPKVEKDEDEDKGEADEKKKEDENGEDSKKKTKKKKDEKKELEPDPITGVWRADVTQDDQVHTLRMRLHFGRGEGSGDVEGNLRCDAASETLVELGGHWEREEKTLAMRGLGSRGWVSVMATLDDEKLTGKLAVDGEEHEISAERTSKEYVVARRPERKREKEEPEKEPKGKPKEPKVDDKLEPLRRAMDGKLTVVVEVERRDEILDCVATFERFGIRPVLLGAEEAYRVKDRIAGRVAGVLLSPDVLRFEPKRGTDFLAPYAELQGAGIPVAFHSGAEEGAIELPLAAAYAVANGMSPTGALRALTADAAAMMSIGDSVGRLAQGLDADVLLLDGPPLAGGTSVLRAWVNGVEVRP